MIPPKIYTYWDKEIPPHIQTCIDSWSKLGLDIIILKYIDSKLGQIALKKSPQVYSDWIRLTTLADKGGIWMDASILINDPIPLLKIYATQKEFAGFTINSLLQTNFKYPVIESWCFMASPQSPFLLEWKNQFDKALLLGFEKYIAQTDIDLQQIVKKYKTYLTIHVCAQVVLQKRYNKGILPHTYADLYRAEETFFKLHTDCKWDRYCIYNNSKKYDMIKLRSLDRELPKTWYQICVQFLKQIIEYLLHLWKKYRS
jgi:hypothetical protein